MAENKTPNGRVNKRQLWGGVTALLAAGGAAGAILAGSMSASAATTPSTESPAAAPSTSGQDAAAPKDDSATPVRGDEKAVTAEQEATLRAAALAAVPGGTVIRVETDAGDATYEAHMSKADGTRVTVKFDANFAVTAVEDGMGKGDPQPADGTGGPGNSGAGPRDHAPGTAPAE